MVIDYDGSAAEYEASLVTKLRGHGAGSFLENWVPDPDPVLGIFNMIEAAWTAGRNTVALRVSRSTLDPVSLPRLKELARDVAELQIQETADAYLLDARRLADSGARISKPSTRPGAARNAVSPHRLAKSESGQVTWPIHPVLAEALNSEVSTFTHEGALPATGGTIVEAVSEGATVSFMVDDAGRIQAARHHGVQPQARRQIVEIICRAIEGRTARDASDHAGSLAIHRLRLRAGNRGTQGVLLSANAGTEFVAALAMTRAACRKYEATLGTASTENFFDPGPGAAWRALEMAEKLRRACAATEAFCRSAGADGGSIKPVRIDKDIHGHEIRLIIQIDHQRADSGVPLLMRRLERFLKDNVEEALQVYLEPLKDKNVLRRL